MQFDSLVKKIFNENSHYMIINFIFALLPYIWLVIVVTLIIGLKRKIFNKFFRILFVLALLLLIIPIYANTVERFWIIKREKAFTYDKSKQTKIEARFAIFSDIHLGVFKDEKFTRQVVEEINKLDKIDAVLVPGDLTYEPELKNLEKYFTPLKESKYPIIMVLGNHDLEKPGPKIRKELENALLSARVTLIDDKIININGINIYGLQDRWIDEYSTKTLNNLKSDEINMVLAHQPDVVRDYDNLKVKPDLTISGHTHCGQIRIPYLYNSKLPTVDNYYDKGLYKVNGGELYISCGIGEVGLPMRLFNPPVIDIVNISNTK